MIVPGGPAEKAGIHRGDTLEAINGQALRNDRHVTQILYELVEWSKATYSIQRDGRLFDDRPVVARMQPIHQRTQAQCIVDDFAQILPGPDLPGGELERGLDFPDAFERADIVAIALGTRRSQ